MFPAPADGVDEFWVKITVAVVNVLVLTLKFLIETIPTFPLLRSCVNTEPLEQSSSSVTLLS